MIHDYAVAYFDILGFKAKLEEIGLPSMLEIYRSLISVVDEVNGHTSTLFGELAFKESVYWTSEGDVVPVVKIFGAYASDSILIWSHAAWPEARNKADHERAQLAKSDETGWAYQTVICDTLLRTCNELICRGVELQVPLRGALSMGKAVLDRTDDIFIGQPLVEAAILEKAQKFIGGGFCQSFMKQVIPQRFALSFDAHIKKDHNCCFSGSVLDWPRHWRQTRTASLKDVIEALRAVSINASEYYDNTLSLISASNLHQAKYGSSTDVSVRSTYPAFSSPNLKARARAVRQTNPPVK